MLKAQEFFTSSNHGDDEWKHVLSQYDDAIKLISLNKKKPNLIDLDKFWRTDFPTKVFDLTTPMRMTLSDISNIMTWKITRGKFRPLQKLVDSNKSSDVESISQSAFKVFTKPLDSSSSYHDVTVLMQENFNWKPVMEKLMSLKAIGPATASAILAPLCPQQFPFMSDEAMLASEPDNNSKKEYTLNAYTIFRQRMITKAKELGSLKYYFFRVGVEFYD